jgi:N-acetylmuramoyl-L-alanine amidase
VDGPDTKKLRSPFQDGLLAVADKVTSHRFAPFDVAPPVKFAKIGLPARNLSSHRRPAVQFPAILLELRPGTAKVLPFMKTRLACGLIGAICVMALAAAASDHSERASFHGVDYVSLSGWAERHHYKIRPSGVGEAVELTRDKSRVVFERDSNFGSINGVNVFLSWPVAFLNGAAYAAVLDVQTVLDPILFPRASSMPRFTTICIDAGHGGKDPGSLAGVAQEKRLTLLLAQEVANELKSEGFKVVLTRKSDTFVEKPDRPAVANQKRAGLFVSLHYNSSDDTGVNGVETYCLTPPGAVSTNAHGEGAPAGPAPANAHDRENLLAAYYIQRSVVREMGMKDRGLHRARFAVLKPLAMPGVLVEGGFLTNPVEMRHICDARYRQKMARAVVDGILAYAGARAR